MKRRLYLYSLAGLLAVLVAKDSWAVGEDNPTGVTGDFNGNITTAGAYDIYTGNVKRVVEEINVPGAVGAYPLKWNRTLNSRDGGYGVFGTGGWSHSYQWGGSVRNADLPPPETGNGDFYEGPDQQVLYPDGRMVGFYGGSAWEGDEAGDQIIQVPADWAAGESNWALQMRDGGKVMFRSTNSNGTGSLIAQAIIDPFGQTTTLIRDSAGRLWQIREPGGRYLQINYGTSPTVPIASVQAFDGRGNVTRTVTYGYTQYQFDSSYGASPYLTKAYYDDGGQASYTYQPSNKGQIRTALIKTCDDTRFAGAMKQIEYEFALTPGVPAAFGQVKAEKNFNTHQIVSQANYPASLYTTPGDPRNGFRSETRGDGPTRSFQYGTGMPAGYGIGSGIDLGILASYTDFQGHWSSFAYGGPGPDRGSSNTSRKALTDARGKVTTVDRNGITGAVKATTSADGNFVTYGYSTELSPIFVTSRTDERGYTTYYDRDGANRIWRKRYPDGGIEQFTYNGFAQIETHTMTSGGVETFHYDGRGRKTDYSPPATSSDPDPWDHPSHYYYYESGPQTDRLYYETDPKGNTTWYEYNLRGQVTKVTHQDGSYTESAYNLDGTLAWTSDELRHPTSYFYDEYKRVLTIRNAKNEDTTTSYGLDANWSNPLLHTSVNPKYVVTPMGKNTVFDYDQNLRKAHQVSAMNTADEAWTSFGYDEVGNLVTTTDPRGKTTTFGYDDRNRQTTITDALGHVTRTDYDAAGNKNWIKRAENTSVWSWVQFPEYDAMNRLKHQIDERGVDTYMDYDGAGNLRFFHDGNGQIYEHQYDALNRQTAMIFPGGSMETTSFDEAGNKHSYTNRAGATQTFAPYDNRNRATSFWWSDGTQGQSYGYDFASRMTQVSNAEADIYFGYDDANRKLWETETIKSYGLWATRTVDSRYDADGSRSRLMYPSGYQFTYEYTQRHQLANIRLDPAIFGGQYQTPIMHYGYDASGNRVNRTTMSGAYAEYDIDEVNRIRAQANYFANGQMGRFDYGYDEKNRHKYEQRDWGSADGFHHDPSDQIDGYQRDGNLNGDGTVSVGWWGVNNTIGYDNNGNRWKLNGAEVYAANNLNQYTSAPLEGGLSYDGKGNLREAEGWTYTYDAQNRVVRMEGLTDGQWNTIVMTYDGLNRVITRSVNGELRQNVWDGWNLVEEHRGDWSVKRCYLYGAAPNEVVGGFDGGEYPATIYWQDGRGNTSHVTGFDGVLYERYTYNLEGRPSYFSPDWGGFQLIGSAYDTRFLFGGSQYLAEANVYDMRNRVYHVDLNRFLQTDPIGFKGDALNLYRYCGNDDADRSDPDGLEGEIFDNLEDAVQLARTQVKGAAFGQKAQWDRVLGRPTTHSKMVPVLQHGRQFELGRLVTGETQKSYNSAGQSYGYETERLSPVEMKRLVDAVHSHNDKTGVARAEFSDFDKKLPNQGKMVERMDESNQSVWHRREPANNRQGYRDSDIPAKGTQGNSGSSSQGSSDRSSSNNSSAPSAADVDAAHQATGVPSLGAEAVNFAPGRP